jgi:hypothetical protein
MIKEQGRKELLFILTADACCSPPLQNPLIGERTSEKYTYPQYKPDKAYTRKHEIYLSAALALSVIHHPKQIGTANQKL